MFLEVRRLKIILISIGADFFCKDDACEESCGTNGEARAIWCCESGL